MAEKPTPEQIQEMLKNMGLADQVESFREQTRWEGYRARFKEWRLSRVRKNRIFKQLETEHEELKKALKRSDEFYSKCLQLLMATVYEKGVGQAHLVLQNESIQIVEKSQIKLAYGQGTTAINLEIPPREEKAVNKFCKGPEGKGGCGKVLTMGTDDTMCDICKVRAETMAADQAASDPKNP